MSPSNHAPKSIVHTSPYSNPSPLKLPHQQIPNHQLPRNPARPPQRREIQRTGQRIRIPKRQHRRNPAARVLEREALVWHAVLLYGAALKMVDGALGVDFGLVDAGGGGIGGLRTA